jgi:hypothetical protein
MAFLAGRENCSNERNIYMGDYTYPFWHNRLYLHSCLGEQL